MQILNEIYSFLSKGGIMMIPLISSSIIALAIILERAFQLRQKKVLDPQVVRMLASIKEPKDIDATHVICNQNNGTFTNLIKVGLENRELPKEELRELLEDQGRQESRVLERGLGALETIAGASPLMGLLGTVIGMIKVFNVISQIGVGQGSALSGGISEALITTVVGLSIGIPVLISYNYFIHKSENLILDIEKYLMVLMQKIKQVK